MMANHHHSNAIEALFEKNLIRKLLKISSTITRRVEVLAFWMIENLIKRLVQISLETLCKVLRNLRISFFDATRIM